MFDIDDFLNDCHVACLETEARRAVRDVMVRAFGRPEQIAAALRPTEGGITLLHHGPKLTIVHVVWAPRMRIYPHDHRMWAAIGLYTGREDNTFYRRSGPGQGSLTESGGKTLTEGQVVVLGDQTIHGVANPEARLTGAIHVYGGDFVAQERSQWGPGPLDERPYDLDETRRQFAVANEAWHRVTTH